jgi:hypothetical protein
MLKHAPLVDAMAAFIVADWQEKNQVIDGEW